MQSGIRNLPKTPDVRKEQQIKKIRIMKIVAVSVNSQFQTLYIKSPAGPSSPTGVVWNCCFTLSFTQWFYMRRFEKKMRIIYRLYLSHYIMFPARQDPPSPRKPATKIISGQQTPFEEVRKGKSIRMIQYLEPVKAGCYVVGHSPKGQDKNKSSINDGVKRHWCTSVEIEGHIFRGGFASLVCCSVK